MTMEKASDVSAFVVFVAVVIVVVVAVLVVVVVEFFMVAKSESDVER